MDLVYGDGSTQGLPASAFAQPSQEAETDVRLRNGRMPSGAANAASIENSSTTRIGSMARKLAEPVRIREPNGAPGSRNQNAYEIA